MGMPAWQEIVKTLGDEIRSGQLAVGERLPSEEQLALRFQVSRQTAHKAVQEVCRMGLVVRKRRWGTFVTEPPIENRLVAVMFDYASDFPQGELLRGIQAGLGEAYHVLLIDAAGDPAVGVRRLEEIRHQVAGILAYPFCDGADEESYGSMMAAYRAGDGVPVVFVDRRPAGVEADLVSSDNYESTTRALEELVSEGHRRIAFFSGDNVLTSTIRERHQAYLDVAEEEGMPGHLERWFPKSLENQPERLFTAIHDALAGLVAQPDAPTAVFCTQDVYAATVLDVLDAPASALPPLALASFNDWPANMFPRASRMHRVVQPVYETGRAAAELLLARVTSRGTDFRVVRTPSRCLSAGAPAPVPQAALPQNQRRSML